MSNRRFHRRQTDKICSACGNLFAVFVNSAYQQSLCETCYGDWRRKYYTDYTKNARLAAIEYLGGECVICGINDERVLEIDHVNNDGYLTRGTGVRYHHNITSGKLTGLQLLCANCHAIKTKEHRAEKARKDRGGSNRI